jgi:hypothetical protein
MSEITEDSWSTGFVDAGVEANSFESVVEEKIKTRINIPTALGGKPHEVSSQSQFVGGKAAAPIKNIPPQPKQFDLKSALKDPQRRIVVDTSLAMGKVGHKNWNVVSAQANHDDYQLWQHLHASGKNYELSSKTVQKTIQFCGESFYQTVRPKLITDKIVLQKQRVEKINTDNKTNKADKADANTKSKKGSKVPVVSKADQIRADNLARSMGKEMDLVFKDIPTEPLSCKKPITFSLKFAEFVIIRMMIQARNLITKWSDIKKELEQKEKSKYSKAEEVTELKRKLHEAVTDITEMIVGYNKITNERKSQAELSETCLTDLIAWIDYSKEVVHFDPGRIILENPQLIFKTAYDGMLDKFTLSMYPSQKEIFEFVTTHTKHLALVHTMLGSGKTTMVVAIEGWLSTQKGRNRIRGIFCCPNKAVLLEVGHMLYAMGTSFAFVIEDKKNKKLQYKWSSYADREDKDKSHVLRQDNSAIFFLCDIYTARIMLESRQKAIEHRNEYIAANKKNPTSFPLVEERIPHVPEYFFIGDELTKDSDSQQGIIVDSGFSVPTEVLVDIARIAGHRQMWLGSTIPTYKQLPEFYDAIVEKNSEMIIRSFAASEAKIGCAMISQTGELFAPHAGSKTVDELKTILETIKSNPMVGRFYTFEVLLNMVDHFSSMGLAVPDLKKLYEDPSTANQTNIQKTAYDMLETLIMTGSNEIVEQACVLQKKVARSVNLNEMLTKEIYRFNKGCLVFSSDPVATALDIYKKNFDHYLPSHIDSNDSDITETSRNIFQQVKILDVISEYNKCIEVYEKELKRLEDGKSDNNPTKKTSGSKERGQPELWQRVSQLTDNRPRWSFPEELQICSAKHLDRVGCTTIPMAGGLITPEDIPEDSAVPAEILMLLASGIGIYSTNNPILDESYLATVMSLAKRGLIKIIFADNSIAYGTNWSVSAIIVIDVPVVSSTGEVVESIVKKQSVKTIFQMLARAGRGGSLSHEARIYTISESNELINVISSYIRNTLDEGTRDEVKNIRRAFEVIW